MAFRDSYGEFQRIASGKVREIYEDRIGNSLMLVATDRVSAFDKQLGIEIPDKGKILTAISAEMTNYAEDRLGLMVAYLCSNAPRDEVVNPYGGFDAFVPSSACVISTASELNGRITLMDKLEMLEAEFIVRGHISGSAWKLYAQGERKICGVDLPDGLLEGDKLPEPIFTPTTKAPVGQHDENITFEQLVDLIGDRNVAEEARDNCLLLFDYAYDLLRDVDVILADTKFELGIDSRGNLAFGDEILTPDSSRFWDAHSFVPGRTPHSYDKQIIRDYLLELDLHGETDRRIPDTLIDRTRQRYIELYEKLTCCPWPEK